MDKLLDKTMTFLQKNQDMDQDTADIVRYGLELFLIKTSFSIVMLVIGTLFHSFSECLEFLISFYLIRSSSGGYHADTRLKCFVQSVTTFVAVILIVKAVEAYELLLIPVALVSCFSAGVIWLFAPVDNENKRLDEDEFLQFRKKSRIILAVEIAISLIFVFIGWVQLSCAVMLALVVTAILLLLGKIK